MSTGSSKAREPAVDPPSTTSVHIINHTHWDREWFTTAEYTTAWIPDLIGNVERLALANADFSYLLDGQTLMIEDLLALDATEEERVRALVDQGALIVGPLYSQPDWRLLGGELLLRNIALGLADARDLGSVPRFAWMVDTFGHLSQTPQMLRMSGIEAVFVWRGVSNLAPRFRWIGPDGSELSTVNLFAGYRNLYGVTHTPSIALERLRAEVSKLSPIYGELPIPLFDGYDLEVQPEDPVSFYRDSIDEVEPGLDLIDSSPARYLEAIQAQPGPSTELRGELLSGKYGSTFPGSLSTRTYQKVMQHDAEHAVHHLAEPLASLAAARGRPYGADRFDELDRMLLRTGVHDVICGVSVDQVHERLERDTRFVMDTATRIAHDALSTVLTGFAPGRYSVCLRPTPARTSVRTGEHVAVVDATHLGVAPLREWHRTTPVGRPAAGFSWSNEHYTATLRPDGCIEVDDAVVGVLRVHRDDGDSYSSDLGEHLGRCLPISEPTVVSESPVDTVIAFTAAYGDERRQVEVGTTIRFDQGPLIHLGFDVNSTGTSFLLSADLDLELPDATTHAGMPFDVVRRPSVDSDLLDELGSDLEGLIMGQRDVGKVDEFPFQDFVAQSDGEATAVVFARGLRSYRVTGSGLAITLRRSMEWIARSGLRSRDGDAGPAMYVPDARCERGVRHEIAYGTFAGPVASAAILEHNATFQTPPLVVSVGHGESPGLLESWDAYAAPAAMSALVVAAGRPTMRVYNPTDEPMTVPTADGDVELVGRRIAAVPVDLVAPAIDDEPPTVEWLNPPTWRVGPRRSVPNPEILKDMEHEAAKLAASADEVTAALDNTDPAADRYRLEHRRYVLDRERAELELSVFLNRLKMEAGAAPSLPDEPLPKLAEMCERLNTLRIKRRIHDYVVALLDARSAGRR